MFGVNVVVDADVVCAMDPVADREAYVKVNADVIADHGVDVDNAISRYVTNC